MLTQIALILLASLVAALLPELWARLWWRRPHRGAGARVALTFDDGPDPVTTPLVLDLLAELDLRATFFVLGERAAAHPDLLRRMQASGHEIGVHGLTHRHHWATPPWRVYSELARARDLIAEVTGEAPRLYRPPWGMVCLPTLFAVRRAGLRLALYDVESGDWLRLAPDAIARRVQQRVRPGSVVLLHDAARDAAQVARMMEALRLAVPALRARGLEFVRMSDLPAGQPRRSLFLRAWIAWEHCFGRMVGAVPVGPTMHLAPYTYRGPAHLRDGQPVLQSGDRCLDIHFNSEALFEMPGHASARNKTLATQFVEEMRNAAGMMAPGARFGDIKAVTAITLFHPIARRLGFHVEPVEPPWRRRFFTRYMAFIKRIYTGSGSAMTREVQFIWMTRDEFITRMLGTEQ